MFTPEAVQRKSRSKWDSSARVAQSETDVELLKLLAEDDELNFTDEPTYKHHVNEADDNKPAGQSQISMDIPSFPIENMPSLQPDDDSVSTFHPRKTVDLSIDEEQDVTETDQNEVTSPITQ
jgi:hypothetical protein